jgi:hypothetical protein
MRHVTGLSHLGINEPPMKQTKWDCSVASHLAHEGDWRYYLYSFLDLDSYQTYRGHDEGKTDFMKEKDGTDVVVKCSAVTPAPIIAGHEVCIGSEGTQAAFALLKLTEGARR